MSGSVADQRRSIPAVFSADSAEAGVLGASHVSPPLSDCDDWMPLMDYAMLHGVSLSTLRRHIKARKIPFRIEGGRYLLPRDLESVDRAMAPSAVSPVAVASPGVSGGREQELERQLRHAQEEIAELKMLIAIYEETLSGKAAGAV